MKGSNTDVLAGRIASRIIHRKTQLANYLNRKTQYWNKPSKLIALFLFCLLFGSLCLYLIIKAFHN
ncbi:hypothetical protein [Mucilaginibacter ginsenosidivorans]|uniref:Uncharacterized protein n=1 Tax=Mucilaginibacter ginsenosidivorans TaxID=398053 RepID=A0A5B8UU47_9SPHI|nr:hypothetical protein [Mucilaginibacter ginsenosidivorans]QEC62453.1 hypothetical protein FRZ54_07585 [Mucilaginibacter ginsenosidivorans]